MRIIKNLLFLLIFIASTLQVPAFCKYAPEFGVRIDLYGTVEQISAIPDPGRNDYPNCLYAVKVKVHSADRQLGDDTAIVVIPVLKNGKLLPENILRVGDKVRVSLVNYNQLPQAVKEIQVSDDIMEFEREYFYSLQLTNSVKFTASPPKSAAAPATAFKLRIPQITVNKAYPQAQLQRRKMIAQALEQCRQQLKTVQQSGAWNVRSKHYYYLAGKKHAEWINDCFFAAGSGVHYSKDWQQKNFVERLSEYNKFLQERNIDLILVRIPGKGDLAAAVFMDPAEYVPNPAWLKFQIACLSNDIEVIDPLPAMWAKRFDYPLFYFYHDVRESHPLTGTSWVTAEILADVLSRYGEPDTSKKIYKLHTDKYSGRNLPRKYYYPDGNPRYPAGDVISFPAVRNAADNRIPEFAPDTPGSYIFLSNSFAAYPRRKSGASIPHYLACMMNRPSAWFYRDGVGNIMLRTLLTHPEYLKNRRAIIMVMHPNQWSDIFPELPKYYNLKVESLQRLAVWQPDKLLAAADKKQRALFRISGNNFLQVLPERGNVGGQLHFDPVPADNIMLRMHLANHSYLTVEVLDKAGKVVDTASLPPGRNDYLDLIFANPGSGFTLSFKNTNGRKLTEITRVEMFSW